jgi:4-amino-4-deoxy-L-arabinose transferase-like glycosyltransferase
MIEAGDWSGIPEFRFNREHPPLAKLMYASLFAGRDRDLLGRPAIGEPIPETLRDEFRRARRFAAVTGAVQVGLVSLVHPVAGLFLAFNSYHTRYTSEALLDGPAGVFAILSMIAFGFSWRGSGDARPTLKAPALVLSAVALGLAVGCKYTYGLVGPVMWLFLVARAGRVGPVLWFPAISVLTFAVVDPALWSDSLQHASDTFSFHSNFAEQHGRAWWHLLALATHALHDGDHAQHFVHLPDRLLCGFALLGVVRAAKRQPVWFAWAIAGTAFIVFWPTKWAHYQLLALPALAMCAAFGVETAASLVRSAWPGERLARIDANGSEPNRSDSNRISSNGTGL